MKYKIYHLKRIIKEFKTGFSNSDSSSDEYKYLELVKLATEDDFIYENFRSDTRYVDILEHVSDELTKQYYDQVLNKISKKDLINLSKSINLTGNPRMIDINGDMLNPITLRYINVALDIKEKFPDVEIHNICEIGPGFGGQSLILNKFFDIKNYTYIDLPEVNNLINKFLKSHKPKFKYSFSTIDEYNSNTKYDLFISNFAFSELPKRIQKKVIKLIISNSNYGYMMVNNFNNFSIRYLNKKQYKKLLPNLKIFNEIPESYIFNKVLTFKNL